MGAEAVATELLRELRHTESRRATWLLDLTTDMSVPTVAAVSVDAQDGRLFAIGFSARRALRNAVEGALLELCQTELALHLALAKRQSGGPSACSAADLITLQRAESIDAHCALLRPLGAPRAGDDAADAPLPEWLSARGIDVALVELTRADLDAVVVRALAPALQAYPGGRVTMRLSDVSRDTGGGDRLSGGVPLM
jgi:ribosomal protein S12 methylthiotransferase accessory factor